MNHTSIRPSVTPESLIAQCVQDALGRGFRIGTGQGALRVVRGRYEATGRPLDPISAVLVRTRTRARVPTLQGIFDDAAKVLGVTAAWVHVFLDGYDDAEEPCGFEDEGHELGAKYRARFLAPDCDTATWN